MHNTQSNDNECVEKALLNMLTFYW